MTSSARSILAVGLWLWAASACADATLAHDDAVKADLRTALILEGVSCDAVTGYEAEGEMRYVVECANGRRYRAYQDDDGFLQITDLLVGPLRLVGEVLAHLPLLKLGSGAVLALTGFACPEVSTVESDGARGHIIGCADGARFHIMVDTQGRVAVQAME